MKRTHITSLALSFGLAIGADAHSRYDYRTAPNGDCEVVDHDFSPPPRRPILKSLVSDLRLVKEELGQGLFEMRDEVRRTFRGDEASYHTHERSGRPSYQPAPGNAHLRDDLDREYFLRREAAMRLERERELAERDSPSRRLGEPPTGIRVPQGHRSAPPSSDPGYGSPVMVDPKPEPRDEAGRGTGSPGASTPTSPAPVQNSNREAELEPPLPTTRETVTESAEPQEKAPPRKFTEAEKRNFPLATKTDTPGFVRSPYPPFERLDVSGFEPGSLAMEPDSDRIFRIPK